MARAPARPVLLPTSSGLLSRRTWHRIARRLIGSLADDLTFTSPQDDHIDKATYLERRFPTVDRLESQRILDLVAGQGDGVFIMYEYQLKTGARHRNAEYITVLAGQVVDIQVFFCGKL